MSATNRLYLVLVPIQKPFSVSNVLRQIRVRKRKQVKQILDAQGDIGKHLIQLHIIIFQSMAKAVGWRTNVDDVFDICLVIRPFFVFYMIRQAVGCFLVIDFVFPFILPHRIIKFEQP